MDLIKDFKVNCTNKDKYIFVYNIANDINIINAMRKASEELKCETYYFPLNNDSSVQSFIYYIYKGKAVITNSYHGTIFSIIFNKPFITIYDRYNSMERYISIGNMFNVKGRLFEKTQMPNYSLLMQPLNINYSSLSKLRRESINFLKNNLKKGFKQ